VRSFVSTVSRIYILLSGRYSTLLPHAITPASNTQKRCSPSTWTPKSQAASLMWRFWLSSFGSQSKLVFQHPHDNGYVCSVPTFCLQTYQKACTYATWRSKCLLKPNIRHVCASAFGSHIKATEDFWGLSPSPTNQLAIVQKLVHASWMDIKNTPDYLMWRFRLLPFSPRSKPTSQDIETCKYAPAVHIP